MSNATFPGDLKTLPEALRALPQAAPERSAWPELAARLKQGGPAHAASNAPVPTTASEARRPRRRWQLPAALAASLALAAFAALLYRHEAATRQAGATTAATVAHGAASKVANAAKATNGQQSTDPAAQLAALQRRSQALEHWLHETAPAAAPLRGPDLAAAAELEDMIGLVDVQLGAKPSARDVGLWRRRVALLEDLTALRWSSYSVAETGNAASTPATLTN